MTHLDGRAEQRFLASHRVDAGGAIGQCFGHTARITLSSQPDIRRRDRLGLKGDALKGEFIGRHPGELMNGVLSMHERHHIAALRNHQIIELRRGVRCDHHHRIAVVGEQRTVIGKVDLARREDHHIGLAGVKDELEQPRLVEAVVRDLERELGALAPVDRALRCGHPILAVL